MVMKVVVLKHRIFKFFQISYKTYISTTTFTALCIKLPLSALLMQKTIMTYNIDAMYLRLLLQALTILRYDALF